MRRRPKSHILIPGVNKLSETPSDKTETSATVCPEVFNTGQTSVCKWISECEYQS